MIKEMPCCGGEGYPSQKREEIVKMNIEVVGWVNSWVHDS